MNAENSGFALLVDVPPSENPPHMYKGTYYKRSGSRQDFMHHYEVLDALNRRRGPWMSLVLRLISVTMAQDGSWTVRFIAGTHNHGRIAAEHVFLKLAAIAPSRLHAAGWSQESWDQDERAIVRYEDQRPVIPNTTMYHVVPEQPISLTAPKDTLGVIIDVRWGGANAPVQGGRLFVHRDSDRATLFDNPSYELVPNGWCDVHIHDADNVGGC